jgi:hypothetical protein
MIDGPYVGWKPTIEDWDRIKICSVLYVDEDGFLSPTETKLKFRGNGGHDQLAPSYIPELHNTTCSLGGQTEGVDPGTRRQTARSDGPTGYGVIQPGNLPPSDFFANNPYLRDGFGAPSPSEFSSSSETSETVGIDRATGGANGTRLTEDSSSVLPMGLMIYNDLMMDIEGTARFLGRDFHDSVLFGPTSTTTGQYPDRGLESQPPNTTHG